MQNNFTIEDIQAAIDKLAALGSVPQNPPYIYWFSEDCVQKNPDLFYKINDTLYYKDNDTEVRTYPTAFKPSKQNEYVYAFPKDYIQIDDKWWYYKNV